ncbi:hypothetical protein Bbelb_022240 [Branchiostoma belcheri]|nr:hypothetical protein Bbelb_022240 [Branchiostoma belcheri]
MRSLANIGFALVVYLLVPLAWEYWSEFLSCRPCKSPRVGGSQPQKRGDCLEKPPGPVPDGSGRLKYVLTVRDHDSGPIQAGGRYDVDVSVSGQYGSQFHRVVVVASCGRLRPLPGDTALRAGTCLGLSTVSNTDNRTKNTVTFTWVAPDERLLDGECVTIRAAVVDEKKSLYQNDGALTVRLCNFLKQPNLPGPNTTKLPQTTVNALQSSLRKKPISSSVTRPIAAFSLRNQNSYSGEKKGMHVDQVQKNTESATMVKSQLLDFLIMDKFQSTDGGHRMGNWKIQPRFRKKNLLNILVRNRRESPSSRTDLTTTTEDDRSLKWRLISKACCRSGSRFGAKPHDLNCDEASRKFVSSNIAELMHLRAVCVEEFAFCCKEKRRDMGFPVESSSHAGSEVEPTDSLNDSTGQQSEAAETVISDLPTGDSSSTAAVKDITIQQACCLNGLRTAYDPDKSCLDEGESYINQTAADDLESTNEATGCRLEFSRCCEALREHVGENSRLPQEVDLASLEDLQLTQHCCRQGWVQGLSPETDCVQSAMEYARLPLGNSTDRQLQCSSKYTECCSGRQAQNLDLDAPIYPSIHPKKTLKSAAAFPNQTTDGVTSLSTETDYIIERILLGPHVTNVSQSTTTYLMLGEQETSQSETSSAALRNMEINYDDRIQPVTEIHNLGQLAGPTTAPLRSVTEAHMSPSIQSAPTHRAQSKLSWDDIGTDTLVVLSKHRRTLRLCCLKGKAVVETAHPKSCQLEADSYTQGDRLTNQVRQSCKDVFVHCCESMDPRHRGPTRSYGRNIRRLMEDSGEYVHRNREMYYS